VTSKAKRNEILGLHAIPSEPLAANTSSNGAPSDEEIRRRVYANHKGNRVESVNLRKWRPIRSNASSPNVRVIWTRHLRRLKAGLSIEPNGRVR